MRVIPFHSLQKWGLLLESPPPTITTSLIRRLANSPSSDHKDKVARTSRKTSSAKKFPKSSGSKAEATNPRASKSTGKSSKRATQKSSERPTAAKQEEKSPTKGRQTREAPAENLKPWLQKWAGIHSRRHRMSLHPKLRALHDQQSTALDAAFREALRTPKRPANIAMSIVHAANTQQSLRFKPSSESLASLLCACISEAEANETISRLSMNGADVAAETLLRIQHVFDVHSDVHLLSTVAREACRDPDISRRAQRALSVLRLLRSRNLVPTAGIIFDCFTACISGLDVEAAATIMQYAVSNKLFGTDGAGSELEYYNGILYAALICDQISTAQTAYSELVRRGLGGDARSDGIYLAVCVDTGNISMECAIRHSLRLGGHAIPDCAYAALIRRSGREKDIGAIHEYYAEFEKRLGGSSERFHESLCEASLRKHEVGAVGQKVVLTGRGDATFAAFQALRTANGMEEAVSLMKYLQTKYGFQPSRLVYEIVIETCWRAGGMDIAKQLRVEMMQQSR